MTLQVPGSSPLQAYISSGLQARGVRVPIGNLEFNALAHRYGVSVRDFDKYAAHVRRQFFWDTGVSPPVGDPFLPPNPAWNYTEKEDPVDDSLTTDRGATTNHELYAYHLRNDVWLLAERAVIKAGAPGQAFSTLDRHMFAGDNWFNPSFTTQGPQPADPEECRVDIRFVEILAVDLSAFIGERPPATWDYSITIGVDPQTVAPYDNPSATIVLGYAPQETYTAKHAQEATVGIQLRDRNGLSLPGDLTPAWIAAGSNVATFGSASGYPDTPFLMNGRGDFDTTGTFLIVFTAELDVPQAFLTYPVEYDDPRLDEYTPQFTTWPATPPPPPALPNTNTYQDGDAINQVGPSESGGRGVTINTSAPMDLTVNITAP